MTDDLQFALTAPTWAGVGFIALLAVVVAINFGLSLIERRWALHDPFDGGEA